MSVVAYLNFHQNLRSYMKQVNEDAEKLIVISKDIEKYGCCVIKNYLKNDALEDR